MLKSIYKSIYIYVSYHHNYVFVIKWYTVELILRSRGRVMNEFDSADPNRSIGPSFSFRSLLYHLKQHRRGQVGRVHSCFSACLPPLLCCTLCFCCQTTFVVCVGGSQQRLCLASLYWRSLKEIHLLKVHAGLRQSDLDLPRYWTPLRRHVMVTLR